MPQADPAEQSTRWKQFLEDYPEFARALLVQQIILVEAAERGDLQVANRMCELLQEGGMALVFRKYWQGYCEKKRQFDLSGLFWAGRDSGDSAAHQEAS